jgi:hypothetical protein
MSIRRTGAGVHSQSRSLRLTLIVSSKKNPESAIIVNALNVETFSLMPTRSSEIADSIRLFKQKALARTSRTPSSQRGEKTIQHLQREGRVTVSQNRKKV